MKHNFLPAFTLALLTAATVWSVQPAAAEDPSADKQAADQPADLADDLSTLDALLEGLEDEATRPAERPAADVGDADGEDIGPAPPADDNPLAGIGRQMREVKGRIDRGDTAEETQFLQKQIVSDLDKLLEQVCKQCQGGQSKPSPGSSAKAGSGQPKGGSEPGQPSSRPNARESQEGTREAEAATASEADPRAAAREAWGHLPERLREQVQAAAFERFLPQYESLIEAYYERLAEEAESR